MNKRFIIIHSSEIIRKGLQSILRDGFNSDFILLEKVHLINDYAGLSDYKIIIFIENQWLDSFYEKYMNPLKERNNDILLFELNEEESKSREKLIRLNTSGADIISRVNKELTPNEEKKKSLTELSEREIDVLRLVALGHANKDIAEKLFISIHTVITHRKHITDKLGIKSISGLTVYAILNKLIDTENIDPATLI